jgi:hypothetical protein
VPTQSSLFARAGQHDNADILVVMGLAIAPGEAPITSALSVLRFSARLIVIQERLPALLK